MNNEPRNNLPNDKQFRELMLEYPIIDKNNQWCYNA